MISFLPEKKSIAIQTVRSDTDRMLMVSQSDCLKLESHLKEIEANYRRKNDIYRKQRNALWQENEKKSREIEKQNNYIREYWRLSDRYNSLLQKEENHVIKSLEESSRKRILEEREKRRRAEQELEKMKEDFKKREKEFQERERRWIDHVQVRYIASGELRKLYEDSLEKIEKLQKELQNKNNQISHLESALEGATTLINNLKKDQITNRENLEEGLLLPTNSQSFGEHRLQSNLK